MQLRDTELSELALRNSPDIRKRIESLPEGTWLEPKPLGDGLPPVEPFVIELLPDSLRAYVGDVAERMQAPLDFPAVVAVACLSGVVGRRATIQPKATDTGWIVIPNLWSAIVAPPGTMKSPCIEAITKPLNAIQSDWRKDFEAARQSHSQAIEEAELRLSAWRDQFKAAAKSGKSNPARPEASMAEPKQRRLLMHDATFEALHLAMADNPAGIMVVRDELTGWLAQLDREGREGERAFCLQAWNGSSPFTLDRIGRGSIHVEACCMSMLGGIQPGRLRSYLADAISDGPSNDGLIQRFQLFVWPNPSRYWKYIDRKPNAEAEQQAEKIFRALAGLDPEAQLRFQFDDAAQALFVEWLSVLEHRLRNETMHPAMLAHLSKYRKLMPALALLFELADRAAQGFVSFVSSVSEELPKIGLLQAQRAAGWCAFLEPHARRAYSCISTPHHHNAVELTVKIKSRKLGSNGEFTGREIYRKGWAGFDSPEKVRLACELLADAEWLRELPATKDELGGRPSQRWQINPRVWQ